MRQMMQRAGPWMMCSVIVLIVAMFGFGLSATVSGARTGIEQIDQNRVNVSAQLADHAGFMPMWAVMTAPTRKSAEEMSIWTTCTTKKEGAQLAAGRELVAAWATTNLFIMKATILSSSAGTTCYRELAVLENTGQSWGGLVLKLPVQTNAANTSCAPEMATRSYNDASEVATLKLPITDGGMVSLSGAGFSCTRAAHYLRV